MARAQLRHVVTVEGSDSELIAVQNARVTVTRVTDGLAPVMWNAATGGSALTNPLLTNVQGEVEAWIDDTEVANVLMSIDANGGTAYRAGQPGRPLSFPTYTERQQISVFVGATTSGSPVSGTFTAGDVVLGRADATFWLCTVGGTPGTWVRLGGDRIIAHVESDATQSGITTAVDITALTLSNFVVSSTALVILDCPYTFGSVDGQNYQVSITDGSNVQKNAAPATASGVNHLAALQCAERITSAGTYTRKGRAARIGGTGSCGVGAGAGLLYWQRLYVLGI